MSRTKGYIYKGRHSTDYGVLMRDIIDNARALRVCASVGTAAADAVADWLIEQAVRVGAA